MNPEHGTYNRYNAGCRCRPCKDAKAAKERAYRKRVAPALVSADQVRDHIAALRSRNVGVRSIAAAAGVHKTCVQRLADGTTKKVQRRVEQKILAVTADRLPDKSFVDAAPTLAHIETLKARGWTGKQLAERLGYKSNNVRLGPTWVTRANADAVAALLDQPTPDGKWTPEQARLEQARLETDRAEWAARQRRSRALRRAETIDSLPSLAVQPPAELRRGVCKTLPVEERWIFFPPKGDPGPANAARAICATCSVADVCARWAIDQHELGIWGGTTERERSNIRAIEETAA